MKKIIHWTAGLFFAASVCITGTAQAQSVGDDVTSHIKNASFEEGNWDQVPEGIHPAGGFVKTPLGWTLEYDMPGWIDAWSGLPNDPNAPAADGEWYYNVWAGDIKMIDLNQKILLPAGAYELSGKMRTSNLGDGQYLYATVGGTTVQSNHLKVVSSNWETLSAFFVVTEAQAKDSLRIGIYSSSKSRNTNGWFQLDDIRLTYWGAPEVGEIFKYRGLITALNVAIHEAVLSGEETSGMTLLLENAQELTDKADDSMDKEEVIMIYDSLGSIQAEILLSMNLLGDLIQYTTDMMDLLESNKGKGYTGEADFDAVIGKALDYLPSGALTPDGKPIYSADLKAMLAELTAASIVYQATAPASAEEPADFTFFIKTPQFTKAMGNTGDIADGLFEGWVLNNASVSYNEFKVANIGGRNCWNNWSNNFTSMDVYQDLTGLRAGFYTVECKTTSDNVVTTNHLYAQSMAGKVTAPASYWYVGPDPVKNAEWEVLQTEKVFVAEDGKLRIGFASTPGAPNTSEGWFCMTDFVLKYYGPDENGYEKALDIRIADAETAAANFMMLGDLTKVQDAVAVGKSAKGKDQATIESAFEVLNTAIELANASISALDQYNSGKETIVSELDGLLNDESSVLLVSDLLNFQNDIVEADSSTYLTANFFRETLQAFKAYILMYDTAPIYTLLPDVYSEENIAKLEAVLAAQYNQISKTIVGKDQMVSLTAECQKAINMLRSSNVDTADNSDCTFMIVNPGADSYDNNVVPEGWTVKRNTGGAVSRGAHYSGDAENSYIDSWDGNAGVLKYTAKQVLRGIPNGTYTLSCVARSTGDGCFVYAIGTDTVKVEAPNNGGEGGTVWSSAPEGSDIRNVNDGKGNGWNYIIVENIVVWSNTMEIGVTTDTPTWNGWWFSCDDFILTYTSTDWNVGVEEMEDAAAEMAIKAYSENGYIVVEGITEYTVSTADGIQLPASAQLAPGIYLVTVGTQTIKVAVQ